MSRRPCAADLSHYQVTAIVDTVVDILADTLASGESIYLRGLATFKVRQAAPKTARNISAATQIQLPERRTVKLILSKSVKSRLNS